MKLPSLTDLQNNLDYDQATGLIIRKTKAMSAQIGDVFGCLCSKTGYLKANFKGKLYNVHRIAYYMGTGTDPSDKQIDHINGIRNDNRIENLRLATNAENNWNKYNTIGVHYEKNIKKWRVRLKVNGKRYNGGCFENKEDAIYKYKELKTSLCSEFYKRGAS
jgi:hypothetical protein